MKPIPKLVWIILTSCLVVYMAALPPDLSAGVKISWPKPEDAFSASILVKIKADVYNLDTTVAEVRFFADTTLIGAVTNPPFNIIWQVRTKGTDYGRWNLRALAVDNLGHTQESVSIPVIYYTGGPPAPVVEIVSPPQAAVFVTPATINFAAEVLASVGDAGPIEFFLDGNSVGLAGEGATLTATTPPISITLTNLDEGEHNLTVRYRGFNGTLCGCVLKTNTLQVVKLGVQSPRLTPERLFQFDVLTSFPGVETIIQASPNLLDWSPIETNRPPTNTFVFTESSPATNNHRFYRVVLPSEPP
jgi:hypothetical protein